jgi:hypothetical protein
MPTYRYTPNPPPLTQEELDALEAEQAAMQQSVPEPGMGGGYDASGQTSTASLPEPAPYASSGDPHTSSGSAKYGPAGVDSYNNGYPVTAGTQPMGYVPGASAPTWPPMGDGYYASAGTSTNFGPEPPPPPEPSASGYYGGADPSAPPLQPGQWHQSLQYPARGAALPTPPQETAPVLGPDLQPVASAIGGVGDWLRTTIVEPFQRNSADTSVFGVDVAPILAPASTPDPPSRESALATDAAAFGWNAARERLEAGYGLPEPAPSAAPLVTGPGATQPPVNVGGGTIFPALTAGVVGGGSNDWAGSGSSRSIARDGGGYRSRGEFQRNVGSSGGDSPFSSPIFDRFVATLARSNPAWLERILGMTRAGGSRGGWRPARGRFSQRRELDPSAFRQMERRMSGGRERSRR